MDIDYPDENNAQEWNFGEIRVNIKQTKRCTYNTLASTYSLERRSGQLKLKIETFEKDRQNVLARLHLERQGQDNPIPIQTVCTHHLRGVTNREMTKYVLRPAPKESLPYFHQIYNERQSLCYPMYRTPEGTQVTPTLNVMCTPSCETTMETNPIAHNEQQGWWLVVTAEDQNTNEIFAREYVPVEVRKARTSKYDLASMDSHEEAELRKLEAAEDKLVRQVIKMDLPHQLVCRRIKDKIVSVKDRNPAV